MVCHHAHFPHDGKAPVSSRRISLAFARSAESVVRRCRHACAFSRAVRRISSLAYPPHSQDVIHFHPEGLSAGMRSGWNPLAAEMTSSGYDVAFNSASTGLFNIWSAASLVGLNLYHNFNDIRVRCFVLNGAPFLHSRLELAPLQPMLSVLNAVRKDGIPGLRKQHGAWAAKRDIAHNLADCPSIGGSAFRSA